MNKQPAPLLSYAFIVFNLPIAKQFVYSYPSQWHLVRGAQVKAPFGKKFLLGVVTGTQKQRPLLEANIVIRSLNAYQKTDVLKEHSWALAQYISQYYFCSLGQAIWSLLPGNVSAKERLFESILEQNAPPTIDDRPIILNEEQTNIAQNLLQRSSTFSYLYGPTGSGKTEIFLHLAQQALHSNQLLVLILPEIYLCQQFKPRIESLFASKFPGKYAFYYSLLKDSQKRTIFKKTTNGELSLIIGTRSALLLPFTTLDFICIDEEHSSSHKSSSSPHYHVLTLALWYRKQWGTSIILSSATPSLEMYHAIQEKRIECYTLSSSVFSGSASVKVIDLKKQQHILSSTLIKRLSHFQEHKKQSLLFLNKRGFLYACFCQTCQYELLCLNCDLPLSFHKSPKPFFLCHHCNYREEVPKVCPRCQAQTFQYLGFGTQFVEEDLKRLLPNFKVLRLDKDQVSSRASKHLVTKNLQDFQKGEYDILLGTEMIGKSFNFPHLGLVAFVLADISLSLPDFRANERLFALLKQVSGRAGRFRPDDEVWLQTFRPHHPIIEYALQGQDEEFYEYELSLRKKAQLPPFSRFIRLVMRSPSNKGTEGAAQFLAQMIKKAYTKHSQTEDLNFSILGPAPCPFLRLNGCYRYQILFKFYNFEKVHRFIRKHVLPLKWGAKLYLDIDVDPLSLL